MIAVDTNILIYAHRGDSPWHDVAFKKLAGLAESPSAWAIPWPCIHEFLSISTHSRIFAPPTPIHAAIDQVNAWFESPSLVLLGATESYWTTLVGMLESAKINGPMVHDARIAGLCLSHGVRELWTADRDFSRFSRLKTINPLVA